MSSRLDEARTVSLEELAVQVRRDVIRMIAYAGAGHPGGALGITEILVAMYRDIMRVEAGRLDGPDCDRLVLSNGHICAAWYALLARLGYIPLEELATFRRLGSRLQGHPARVKLPGLVETSSGPLGQGLSVANGLALSLRLRGSDRRVFCVVGDGELHEGQVWEAALTAAHYGLSQLTLIVTYNGLQIDGEVEKVKRVEPVMDKFAAFGWATTEIDGHDFAQITEALRGIDSSRPTMVLARTVMGKGVPFMENGAMWHGTCPSQEQTAEALAAIGVADGLDDFPIHAAQGGTK